MTAPRSTGGVAAVPIVRQVPNGQPFTFVQHHLEYQTQPGPWFLDITEDVRQVVSACGVHWGQVTVFSNHTTAAIRIPGVTTSRTFQASPVSRPAVV